ncbi:MAG: ATP-binding protein [Mycoplasmataceae bacterium]|jgi:signal transduction histidine kinase|nr:ATP-binding protein [Mycoplasmataceae bacterium]
MNELYFSVKTGLKDIIGKDLITDDNIAIFELVKNSYDARANNVIITFEENKIIIADDGKGMSYDDLIKKWLAVAYSAKNDGTEDIEDNENDEKRESYRDKINMRKYYAGAKGIGRFSCDRLGNKLILTTQKQGKPIEQLTINWNEFEKDQKEDFEKVKVPHSTISSYHLKFPNNFICGTILEIENTEKWNREKIKQLKHSLEKLINPFSETIDFNIEIVSERDKKMDNAGVDEKGKEIIDRDKINGKVSNSILDILKLKTTQINVRVEKNIIETKLIDRDTLIYHIKEINKFNPYIDNLVINLYYLNRSAKTNFTRRMGMEPVKYGSVFLFKNGFRVQPYGNTGDDSWRLDFRLQQGYNRFLSSRDLFGRVDITTNNVFQFKEVSSRDGGLVETSGYQQLMDIFTFKTHRRLERYVVGVLWGEAFIKNKYFKSDDLAMKFRDELLKDKDSEDISIAKSNVGSKIDFIRLIKNLSDEKEVEIIEYNKDLVDLVNENLKEVQPKFIKDLEKIAEATGDPELQKTITLTDSAFRKLQQEKEDAEKRALEEERKRKKAEEVAKKAEEEKLKAEQRAKEEEERRRKAENEKLKAENERIKAENEKLKAEQKAKEEAERRKKAEEDKKKTDAELEREKKQGIFQRSIIGREKEQILGLQHQINHSSSRIKNNVKLLLEHISKSDIDDKMKKYISIISLESAKIESLSNFVTNANFDLKASEIKIDIIQFINEYIKEIYLPDIPVLNSTLKIKVNVPDKLKYIIEFRPLEITTFIDNFIQNAEKAGATTILFEFEKTENHLVIIISDNGKGIPIENINRIFDLGFTTTNGSGIGLFNVKSVVQKMKGKIDVSSEANKGTTFKVGL